MRKFLLAAMMISSVACATTHSADRGLGEPSANIASSEGNSTYGASQNAAKPGKGYEPANLNGPSPTVPSPRSAR
jgi:hypothetical protein